jgi:Protein of unknown function (DUF3617)
MRALRFGIILNSLCLVATVFAGAQGRKPGLWEMTSTMTWLKSPIPPGTPAPAGSPFTSGPRTTQICLTQAIIDKYGAPVPQMRGECQIDKVQKSDHGMTADMVCIGRMTGNGTIQSTWTDPEHAKGGTHFTGTMQGRNSALLIEWTTESTSVYKGADCGDVRPLPIPER